jgi:hypothetical protein
MLVALVTEAVGASRHVNPRVVGRERRGVEQGDGTRSLELVGWDASHDAGNSISGRSEEWRVGCRAEFPLGCHTIIKLRHSLLMGWCEFVRRMASV